MKEERARYLFLFLSFSAGVISHHLPLSAILFLIVGLFHAGGKEKIFYLLFSFFLGFVREEVYHEKWEKSRISEKEAVIYVWKLKYLGKDFFFSSSGNWGEILNGHLMRKDFSIIFKSKGENLTEGVISCRPKKLSFRGSSFERYLFHSGFFYICFSAENLVGKENEREDKSLRLKSRKIMRAIVYGEKWGVEKEDVELYKRAGIIHLLSISGFHMAVLYSFTFFALQAFIKFLNIFPFLSKKLMNRNLRRTGAVLSLILCLFYLSLTGNPVSARRAFVFLLLHILTNFSGKSPNEWEILFQTGLIILLLNPHEIFSVSFQLSFTAVGGVFYYYKNVRKRFFREGQKFYFLPLEIFLLSLCVLLTTSPVTYFHFSTINIISPIFNILAIPVYSLLVPFFFIGEILSEENFLGVIFFRASDLLLYLINLIMKRLLLLIPFQGFVISYNPFLFLLITVSLLLIFFPQVRERALWAVILFIYGGQK